MGLSDCVWVSAIVYGSQRLCMGLSDRVWVSAIVYGSQRLCMGLSDYVWVSAIMSLCYINCLIFVTETWCVHRAVWTEFVIVIRASVSP